MINNYHRAYYEYLKGNLGWFHTNLFDTIKSADDDNLGLLELGFPGEVAAYRQFKSGEITLEAVELELSKIKVHSYKVEDGER